jgi:RimJ/RimL family protein N-acetyltransferase
MLAAEGGVSAPDAEGRAIFGYAVVAGYRDRGLATEFANALIGVAHRAEEPGLAPQQYQL